MHKKRKNSQSNLTVTLRYVTLQNIALTYKPALRTSKPKISRIAKDMSLVALLMTPFAFLTSQLNNLEYRALLKASLKKTDEDGLE